MIAYIVPFTGVIDMTNVCNEVNHPDHSGLRVTRVTPEEGEYSRIHITGELKEQFIEPRFLNQVYCAGTYDLICSQKAPQDWGGWFND